MDFNGLDRSAVFAGQPIIGEVKVDPCRLDRSVPRLGLDRLEGMPASRNLVKQVWRNWWQVSRSR